MDNKDLTGKTEMDSPQMEALIERAKNNRNTIIIVCILVVLIIFGLVLYFYIANSNSAKADEAIGRADAARNDSIALVLYEQAAEMGHKSGNRASAMAAISLYKQGKYQEALDYLKDTDIKDKVVAAGVYSLMGDCYVNLNQYQEALKAYDKAVSKADNNPTLVPVFLIKKANIYRSEENYAAEYEALKTIVDKYPQFVSTSSVDIRKYYERAKASAGK